MDHFFSGKDISPRERITRNISQTTARIDDYYDLVDCLDKSDEDKIIECITGEKMALRTLEGLLDKYGDKELKKDKKEDKKEKKEEKEDKDDDVEVIFLDELTKKGKK